MEPIINRVYDIRVQGYAEVLDNLNALTAAFVKMDATKRKTDEQLQKAVEAGNAVVIDKLKAKLADLELKLKDLDKQRQASAREVEILAKAEQLEADAKLKLSKATTEQAKTEALEAKAANDRAKANAVVTKSIIDQEKEIDRQIAAEEKANKKKQESAKYTNAEAGSYYALIQAYRDALELYRTAGENSPFFEKVKADAIQAKSAVDAFNRSLSPDGTLVGEYKTGILNAYKNLGLSDILTQQRNDINNQLTTVSNNTQRLTAQLRLAGTTGSAAFTEIDSELKKTLELQMQLEANLRNINTTLEGTGGIGTSVTKAINEEFKNLKTNFTQFVVGYAGFQAVISGSSKLISNTAELSDKYVDLQRVLGVTDEQFLKIEKDVKSIDTRTSLNNLFDTAIIAAKAGVAKENIAGVTKAIDELQLVAGKELGDVDTATTSIVKLINIFEGQGQVTEQNILRFGNALVELANKGVASGDFLVDYAQRLAGIQGITGIQIQSVLGLASAFQEQGQSAEVSATAISQILGKVGADVEKYAAIAKKPVESFREILRTNPAEAILELSEGLKGNATALDEIAPKFADLQAKGVRIQQVFGVMAGGADVFRQKINIASAALTNTAAITEGARAKQETFAATLDKIGKQFELIGNNRAFQITLTAIATGLAAILTNLTPLLAALALYAVVWGIANSAMLVARATTLASNVALTAQYAIMVIGQTVTRAYGVALEFLTGVTQGATVATRLFAIATRLGLGPLGVMLTLLGVLLASFRAFGAAATGSSEALKKLAIQNKISSEVHEKAADSIAEQTSKLESLVQVVTSSKTSYDTSRSALDELTRSNARFGDALKGNVINLNEVKRAMADVKTQIELNANAQAAADLSADKYKGYLQVVSTRQKLERTLAANNNKADVTDSQQFTDEERRTILSLPNINNLPDPRGDIEIAGVRYNSKTYFAGLKKIEESALKEFSDYNDFSANLQTKLVEKQNERKKQVEAQKTESSFAERLKVLTSQGGTDADYAKLKQDIEEKKSSLNRLSGEYKNLQKLEDDLETFLKPKKEREARADRLSPKDKNNLNSDQAKHDNDVAQYKLEYLQAKQNHNLSVDEEIEYLTRLQEITEFWNQKKIDSIKGTNASEEKERAELALDIINQQIETNEKIKQLNQKAFDEESNVLKKRLENQKTQIQLAYGTVVNDPEATNTQKARAKKEMDDRTYSETVQYYNAVHELAVKYKVNAQTIEEEKQRAITEIIRQSLTDNAELVEAKYKDIEAKYEQASVNIKTKFNLTRDQVIVNGGGKDRLDRIDKAENVQLATNEVDKQFSKVTQSIDDALRGKITQKQQEEIYDGYVKAVQNLQGALQDAQPKIKTLAQLIQDGISKLLGGQNGKISIGVDKEGNSVDGSDLLGQTLASAYQTGQAAMNAYFDNERARIEQSRNASLQRLDVELSGAKKKAQSQAEQESLDKQYAAKKAAVDKEAGEKLKKVKKAEAKIALATELANIGVAAAQNPLNGITLGAAGIAMYGILAALAFARFALNTGTIDSQQFADSGKVKPFFWKRVKKFFGGGKVTPEEVPAVNLPSGKIVTTPNIPMQPNGDNVLATVRVGEVILNEEHQKRLGGSSTFKRIGVPGFASGGLVPIGGRFGGSIDSLAPPYDPSSFIKPAGSTGSGADMRELREMIAGTNERINRQTANLNILATQTNQRIDKLKVQVVASEVIDTDNNTKKASSIGTIG